MKINKSSKIDLIMIQILIVLYVVFAYPIQIHFGFNLNFILDLLLFVVLLRNSLSYKHKFSHIIVIFVLIILVLISNIFAEVFIFYQVIRLIRFILVSYLLYKMVHGLTETDKLLKSIIISAILSVFWLLRQYIFGWTAAEELWIINTLNSNPDLSYIGTTRFFATFPYANVASLFFMLSAYVCAVNIRKGPIYFIGFMFSILGVFLVQMRIGYYVLPILFVIFLRKRNISKLVIASLLALFLIFVNNMFSIISNDFFSYIFRKLSEDNSISSSLIARLNQISNALVYFSESIFSVFFGKGLGSDNLIVYIDNLFITIVYQNGLIFSMILIFALGSLVSKSFRCKDIKYKINIIILLIIVAAYSISSNALNSGIVYNVFIIILAIINGSNKHLVSKELLDR